MCRCTVKGCTDVCCEYVSLSVAQIADSRADTVITRALIRAELLKFFGIEIIRMRVKRVQHSVDGGFNNYVVIHLSAGNVICFDDRKSLANIALNGLTCDRFVGSGCCSRPLPGPACNCTL